MENRKSSVASLITDLIKKEENFLKFKVKSLSFCVRTLFDPPAGFYSPCFPLNFKNGLVSNEGHPCPEQTKHRNIFVIAQFRFGQNDAQT